MKKVKAGQAVDFKASEWNQIVDATNYVNQTRARGGQAIERSRNYLVNGSDIILGVNNTGATINQFDAVALGETTPATSHSEWHQKIAVNVDWPTGDLCENLAIAQEGIAAGEFGRIMVSGVSPARIAFDKYHDGDDLCIGQAGGGTLKTRGAYTGDGKDCLVGGIGLKLIHQGGATGGDQGLVSVGQFSSCHSTRYLGNLTDDLEETDTTFQIDGLVALNGKATSESLLDVANPFEFYGDDDALALVEWDEAGERWILVQVGCQE